MFLRKLTVLEEMSVKNMLQYHSSVLTLKQYIKEIGQLFALIETLFLNIKRKFTR